MSSVFSTFDCPYTLTKYDIVEGYHTTSGVWVPQSATSTTFSGHLSAVTEKELQFLPETVREKGVMRLAVEASDVTLNNGDKIVITEYGGTASTWYVYQEAGSTYMLSRFGINRRMFYISLTKN